MNYVVTIADRNYLQYAQRFFISVRGAGWRGKCVLFTPDDKMYCNEEVIHLDKPLRFDPGPKHNDCRWRLFNIPHWFQEGDKVMFFDPDVVVTEIFPFDMLFEQNFAITYKPRGDVESHKPYLEALDKILETHAACEYISTPMMFTKDEKFRHLFGVMKLARHAAVRFEGGINVTLTAAITSTGIYPDFQIPRERVCYTLDIKNKCEPEEPWLYHYGGRLGKKYWAKSYGQ